MFVHWLPSDKNTATGTTLTVSSCRCGKIVNDFWTPPSHLAQSLTEDNLMTLGVMLEEWRNLIWRLDGQALSEKLSFSAANFECYCQMHHRWPCIIFLQDEVHSVLCSFNADSVMSFTEQKLIATKANKRSDAI